jgi:hypothetical protein
VLLAFGFRHVLHQVRLSCTSHSWSRDPRRGRVPQACACLFTPQVMHTLKALAADGHTVVCSIHQPRSSIFSLFDDLLLLCDGEEVSKGRAAVTPTNWKPYQRARLLSLVGHL